MSFFDKKLDKSGNTLFNKASFEGGIRMSIRKQSGVRDRYCIGEIAKTSGTRCGDTCAGRRYRTGARREPVRARSRFSY